MGLTKKENALESIDYALLKENPIKAIGNVIDDFELALAKTDIHFLKDMKKYLKDRNYEYVEVMIKDWTNELQSKIDKEE